VADITELAAAYNTDKGSWSGYLETYDRYLSPLRTHGAAVTVFEMGVKDGGSLQLWRDYLPDGTVVGLDLELPKIDDPSGRIHMYQGSQDDESLLRRIAATEAPDGFDVIIDDCAHQGVLALSSFRVLFPLLTRGGVYFIEDWGAGYWPSWIDGSQFRAPKGLVSTAFGRLERPLHRWSGTERLPTLARRSLDRVRDLQQRTMWRQHQSGMVGFVKMLVDEVGVSDVQRGGARTPLEAPIDELVFRPGVVVVLKAT
jgi:hypothetical protein